jgi:hypothetical protein
VCRYILLCGQVSILHTLAELDQQHYITLLIIGVVQHDGVNLLSLLFTIEINTVDLPRSLSFENRITEMRKLGFFQLLALFFSLVCAPFGLYFSSMVIVDDNYM